MQQVYISTSGCEHEEQGQILIYRLIQAGSHSNGVSTSLTFIVCAKLVDTDTHLCLIQVKTHA